MKYKKYISLGMIFILLLLDMGCRPQADGSEQPAAQKIEISMMYPMKLSHFEALVEKEYPEIDLQVEMTTTATMNGDSERRLRKGHGTDLVVTTMPTGEVKDYVMDVSAEEFATSYQGSVASPVMIEGQTRYLPLPGQYTGYILNKTLAAKLGKKLPESNEDLTELFRAGKAQGIGIGEDGVMFGLTTVSASSIGSYIIGTQVPDFLGTSEGIKWMADFEAGTAGFSDVWDSSLDLLLEWVSEGYLNAGSLSLQTNNATPIETRMLNGTLLLAHGNVQLFTKISSHSNEYEYTMLPYLSDKGNSPWVTSEPDGYVGINSLLEGEENKEKLDACIHILELLSTQEGQEAWMEDTSASNSYLSDFESGESEVAEEIAACINDGYIYDLQLTSNIIQYFGKNMALVLDQKMQLEEALAALDDYCRNGSEEVDYDQSIVGSVAGDLIYEDYNTRREETTIGNLITDAVKEYSGADIAVVNGGGIRASLYKGDILGEELNAVCPYPNKIILVEAKGSVIVSMLENGISQTVREDTLPAGRFLQVSGLCYSYRQADEEQPSKLLSVTLEDGSALEPDVWYTLAITDYMAGSGGYIDNNGDGFTMLNLYSDSSPKAENIKLIRETGATYGDALREYFQNHKDEPVSVELEGRITVVGDNDD